MSLVKMVMNDDSWYVVRNTRGVTGFVGPGSKPVPLSPAEIRSFGISSDDEEAKPVVEFAGKVGDQDQDSFRCLGGYSRRNCQH